VPDALAHIAAADLAGRCRSREVAHLLLGAILPDLLSRPAARIVPPALEWAVEGLHAPFVVLLIAIAYLLIALPQARRKAAGGALLFGALTHYVLDAFQIQVVPAYYWLFPFSWKTGKVDLFWPEQSLYAIPVLVGAVAAVRIGRWWKARRAGRTEPAGSPAGG